MGDCERLLEEARIMPEEADVYTGQQCPQVLAAGGAPLGEERRHRAAHRVGDAVVSGESQPQALVALLCEGGPEEPQEGALRAGVSAREALDEYLRQGFVRGGFGLAKPNLGENGAFGTGLRPSP